METINTITFNVPSCITLTSETNTTTMKEMLISFLERCGYKVSNKDAILKTNYDKIICYDSTVYGCDYPSGVIQDCYDCGTNIGLFTSIAPMSDDTDYMQLYITNKGELVRCEKQHFYEEPLTKTWREWHKATLDEIIELSNTL